MVDSWLDFIQEEIEIRIESIKNDLEQVNKEFKIDLEKTRLELKE